MAVLIVESDPDLAQLWQRHMQRQGLDVERAEGQLDAVAKLQLNSYDVVVMNLVLQEGSAMAVADFASYRHPETRIVFVTNTSFFSDGSIFSVCANAQALLQTDTPPEDLTAMVEHYAKPQRPG